jgi:hypothetical protein
MPTDAAVRSVDSGRSRSRQPSRSTGGMTMTATSRIPSPTHMAKAEQAIGAARAMIDAAPARPDRRRWSATVRLTTATSAISRVTRAWVTPPTAETQSVPTSSASSTGRTTGRTRDPL